MGFLGIGNKKKRKKLQSQISNLSAENFALKNYVEQSAQQTQGGFFDRLIKFLFG